MHNFANTILWVYIVLLLVGGLMGFLKVGSKVSLISSSVFAAVLVLTQTGIFEPTVARNLVNVLLAALLVVFAIRLAKTKKFMPSGLMLVLTILTLALRNIFKG
ncbi:MAG: TMEM14 family protein [Limisphaerales bacterium]